MGWFDFFRRQKVVRRRRKPVGPFEPLPSEKPDRPLPRFNRAPNAPLGDDSSTGPGATETIVDAVFVDATVEIRPGSYYAAQPRYFHHALAQAVLRRRLFESPSETLRSLAATETARYFDELLEQLVKERGVLQDRLDFSGRQIRTFRVRAGRMPCLVVEMPAPRALGEAFFAAVVVTADPRKAPQELDAHDVRYFTLNLVGPGPYVGDEPATELCEWAVDGRRRSYGTGPAPRLDPLLGILGGMLREQSRLT